MQINAPATITPVVNINQPTEALRTDVRRLERIPESAQSSDSARLKQGGSDQESLQRIPEGAREQRNSEDLQDDNESLSDSSQSNSQTEAQEQQEIRELRTTDREVRAHEAAHASVGGVYAGNPSFTFVTGPDGVRYAVAGEVPIDVSEVPGDPLATLEKMRQVRRAALAPADPSNQDRQIAAQASAAAAEAAAELAVQNATDDADESAVNRNLSAQRDNVNINSVDEAQRSERRGGLEESTLNQGEALNQRETPNQREALNVAVQNRFLRRLQSSGAVASPPAGVNINTQA